MRFEISKFSGSLMTALLLLLTSCTSTQVREGMFINSIPAQIHEDLAVSGTIRVKGEVKVFSGATLTVKPGTRFLFEPFDPDNDGVNDSRLLIEGVLVARGEPDAPIYFSSAPPDPQPGDWLELRMDHSEGCVLEYCVLEHSRYGLHVHFSSGTVANCVFRNNIDGTRFGGSRFDFLHNRVTRNLGKGINLRASRLQIGYNILDNNRYGVFLFEEGGGTELFFNMFSENSASDLGFGDFYKGEPPKLHNNYRKGDHAAQNSSSGNAFDQIADTFDSNPPDFIFGPRQWNYKVAQLWMRNLDSFIFVSPVLSDDEQKVIVSTWGGGLYVLDRATGVTLSRIEIQDVLDAFPVSLTEDVSDPSGGQSTAKETDPIIFISWDSKIRKVDVHTGEIQGEIRVETAPTVHNLQAAPPDSKIRSTGHPVALGLWNRQFGLLDPASMQWLWRVELAGGIRARAAQDDGYFWIGTYAGFLYRISPEGEIQYRLQLGSQVRTVPLVVEKGSVVVVSGTGILVCIKDGKIAWRRQLPGPGTYASPSWLTPSKQNFVAGGGSGKLSAYSKDGALMWVTDLGSAIHVIVDNYPLPGVFAGTEDGSLYGINYLGRIVFRNKIGGAIHGLALTLDDEDAAVSEVIWGSEDGTIQAVRLTEEISPWGGPQ